MALKQCKECKKEISSDANPCPNCGKKNPHGMPKWLKYSGGAAVVLAIIGAAAAPSKTKDNAGASTRPAAVAPAAAAPSAPTAPAAPTAKAPDVTVDAIKLWRDYDANEVAADGAYKGKLLQVTGTVASIDKDILGDIVVHLRSPNEFMNTRATLEKSETSKAAALNKGAHVTLQCTGKGRIVGSPSLDDCTFVE
jgi:hypothetical protein